MRLCFLPLDLVIDYISEYFFVWRVGKILWWLYIIVISHLASIFIIDIVKICIIMKGLHILDWCSFHLYFFIMDTFWLEPMLPRQPWFIPCSYRFRVSNEEQGIQKLPYDLHRLGDMVYIKMSWIIQIIFPKFVLKDIYALSIGQEAVELKDILSFIHIKVMGDIREKEKEKLWKNWEVVREL